VWREVLSVPLYGYGSGRPGTPASTGFSSRSVTPDVRGGGWPPPEVEAALVEGGAKVPVSVFQYRPVQQPRQREWSRGTRSS